jgi:uncharacterized protein (DUF608 family)
VPGGWDADQDGVMEGAQHNTYDVEFFGPNPMMTSWYLAALTACREMAEAMDDSQLATRCADLRERGAKKLVEICFNGEYYEQRVQPATADYAELTVLHKHFLGEDPPYQVGAGCLIDQLVGQYKANLEGLGDLLPRETITATLGSIVRLNHRSSLRDHANNMRTYALNDESGVLICSYAQGERPRRPFPYWSEVWTGLEYQLASLLLDYGMEREAETVVKGVRQRHDGSRRNPFDEPECGHYYARSLAAWAVLRRYLT